RAVDELWIQGESGRFARSEGVVGAPSRAGESAALLLLDPARELGDLVVGRAALGHLPGDLLVRVHHRGVVAAAELLPDLRQGEIAQLSAEVHGDLTGGDEHAGP